MTLLELARKHDELATAYERSNEDPPVDHRATSAALRLLHEREQFVSYVNSESNGIFELRLKLHRLLSGEKE